MANSPFVQKKSSIIRVLHCYFTFKNSLGKRAFKTSDEKEKTHNFLFINILYIQSRFLISLVGDNLKKNRDKFLNQNKLLNKEKFDDKG